MCVAVNDLLAWNRHFPFERNRDEWIHIFHFHTEHNEDMHSLFIMGIMYVHWPIHVLFLCVKVYDPRGVVQLGAVEWALGHPFNWLQHSGQCCHKIWARMSHVMSHVMSHQLWLEQETFNETKCISTEFEPPWPLCCFADRHFLVLNKIIKFFARTNQNYKYFRCCYSKYLEYGWLVFLRKERITIKYLHVKSKLLFLFNSILCSTIKHRMG